MRKFLLAAVAAAAIASPAAARDGTGYVGADLGAMLAEDTKLDFDNDTLFINNAVAVDYGLGFDIGLVGGYDFGMVRAEFDLGYKHAGANEVVLGQGVCTTAQNCVLDADGDASVLSAMANVILDFGDENGITGFIGLGAGMARVGIDTDFSGTFPNTPVTGFGVDDDDTALAGQIIAGLRMPVSENMDAGLKYRYFNTQKLKFSDGTDHLEGHWRSHSLLVSLTYNFYSPPPPPPPPAPERG